MKKMFASLYNTLNALRNAYKKNREYDIELNRLRQRLISATPVRQYSTFGLYANEFKDYTTK